MVDHISESLNKEKHLIEEGRVIEEAGGIKGIHKICV